MEFSGGDEGPEALLKASEDLYRDVALELAAATERLVGGNTAILSKMLERVLASADKPAPGAVVQINNNQSVGADVLPPMPRLINPMEDFDG